MFYYDNKLATLTYPVTITNFQIANDWPQPTEVNRFLKK